MPGDQPEHDHEHLHGEAAIAEAAEGMAEAGQQDGGQQDQAGVDGAAGGKFGHGRLSYSVGAGLATSEPRMASTASSNRRAKGGDSVLSANSTWRITRY